MDAENPTKAGKWGFPAASWSSSYWMKQDGSEDLRIYRSSPELPEKADCVIIGSGITGCLAADAYIQKWPSKKVLILEAREFCSGATGRNAGHCRPDSFTSFGRLQKRFGSDEALKIIHNQNDAFEALVSFIHANDIKCDLWTGDTLQVPMTEAIAKQAKEDFLEYKAAGGDAGCVKMVEDPVTAVYMTHIKQAQACYSWPAATMHPQKLAASIMRLNLKLGVALYTNAMVSKVNVGVTTGFRWDVMVDRKAIACNEVVHASNAYLSAYEPMLRELISPFPHICTQVEVPKSVPRHCTLRNSYGIMLAPGARLTINPRLADENIVLFGGFSAGHLSFYKRVLEDSSHYVDDDISNIAAVSDEVWKFASTNVEGWKLRDREIKNYTDWSGIIALTRDGLPMVGQLHGKQGQWVCGGYNGGGMAEVFTMIPALIMLMWGAKLGKHRASGCLSAHTTTHVGGTEYGRVII